MRSRKKTYTEGVMQNNIYIVKNPTENRGKWQEIFKNKNPIHLEIGTGKGNFIRSIAEENQNINFIGIEKEKEIISMAAKILENTECKNVFLINSSAQKIIEIFEDGEVEKIYLNFSDPWPKSGHIKRRLTYSSFLEIYKKILYNNGEIEFKTDNKFLFNFSLKEFEKNNFELKYVSRNLHEDIFHTSGQNIVTEYEDKFSNMGFPIFRIVARKI
ncbi:MAG: tRNA (guanosine(46)-N7)-methyltransferase TrmB [Defluviitaleaceae bacterium]|nr:tRNA (guanosine(46)-N7)-methyltransferase TrmB [Defluviitaleaceae bacterium]